MQNKRDDLWVIIMSAILDKKSFTDYFSVSVLIEVEDCRRFTVTVHYLQQVTADPIADAVERVLKIHKVEPDRSVLVFVSRVYAIARCFGLIQSGLEEFKKKEYELTSGKCDVYSLHAKMKKEDQDSATQRNDTVHRWCDRGGKLIEKPVRNVMVSTNVAETSLKTQGLVYVIDTGFEKRMRFDPEFNSECSQRNGFISQVLTRTQAEMDVLPKVSAIECTERSTFQQNACK